MTEESPSSSSKNDPLTTTKTTTSSSSYTLQDYLVLPTIVFAQFAGTSLWFAPNAVVSQIDNFEDTQVATLVSCVQIGFIIGTLLSTYYTIPDRVIPSVLFVIMTIIGAILNFICVFSESFLVWSILRLFIGICLASVYPVGMKIAAMEYPNGLGARLGILVGALTLGTAFPWLVKGIGSGSSPNDSDSENEQKQLPVVTTLASVSILAIVGSICMAIIMIPRQRRRTRKGSHHQGKKKEEISSSSSKTMTMTTNERQHDNKGPGNSNNDEEEGIFAATREEEPTIIDHMEKSQEQQDATASSTGTQQQQLTGVEAFKALTSDSRFRASALGYFGHMFELYSLWAYIPILVEAHAEHHEDDAAIMNVALTTFLTIGIGAISCSLGGYWSLYAGRNILPGSAVVAEVSLIISGICCLLAPLYKRMSPTLFFVYMMIWGFTVVSDSAQFSSLSATYAHKQLVGTALTLTTCIGFAITVVSIQVIGALLDNGVDPGIALSVLAIGPILGVYRTMKEWPLHHLLISKNNEG